ncbi:phospholipase D family protein [Rhizobium sp. No.120]
MLTDPKTSTLNVISFYLREPFGTVLANAYKIAHPQMLIVSDVDSLKVVQETLQKQVSIDDMRADMRFIPTEQAGTEDEDLSVHAKIAMIGQAGSPWYSIIFTSDNFNISTAFASTVAKNANSANFENYNFITDLATSAIVKAHQCMFDAIGNLNTSKPFSLQDVGVAYEFCVFHRKARAELSDPARFYLLPYDVDRALTDIAYQAGKSEEIDVAGYNAGNPCLASLLKGALAEGKKVRLVTDDDVCQQLPPKDGQWYSDLEQAGAELRFMQTNGDGFSPLSNRFHHKFMVFKQGDRASVLSGSANFTCAAFSKNLEASYVLSDKNMTRVYSAAFDDYWQKQARLRDEVQPCR